MTGRFLLIMVTAALSLFTGCTFVVDTPETTVTVRNDLSDLVVNNGNGSFDVTYVNLTGVTIGDVYFSAIGAGEVTDAVTTGMSGDVDIDIGSAAAMVATAQGNVSVTLSDIETMTTFIRSGEDNEVIFDETSASVVLASLQIPVQTAVIVENDLRNLVLTVNGSTVNIAKIDLKDVVIGDVRFPSINAGSITDAVATARNGTVDIDIGSATAAVSTAQGTVSILLSDIGAMTAAIQSGKENTVVFDESSASVILASLRQNLKTTIMAKNDLQDLVVSINGATNDIEKVDLFGVSIGDVDFARVDAGTTTVPRVTSRSGTVDLTIDSAEVSVVTTVLGQTTTTLFTFTGIDPMETDIEQYQENTVIFDETTAANIFAALAKRMASR